MASPEQVRGRPDVAPRLEFGRLRKIKARDYAARFVLGATISICAAVIAKEVGPRFGGLFLAFPAILPASLTLVQEEDGTRDADRTAVGAVLGGFAMAVFAAVAEKTLLHLPVVVSLLLALASWLVTSLALYWALAFFRPQDCDRHRD